MRSLFIPLPLLLAPLAVPLIFTSPAGAQVGPSCCVIEAEHHPGEPPHPRNPLPYLFGAKVTSPDERALEASAEAPMTADPPLVNAIGIPLDEEERRGVSEPEFVPVMAGQRTTPPPDSFPPCCRIVAETHPGEPPHPENLRPVLIAAKVKSPDERALKAAAEAQIEKATQLVNAIGIPLSAQRGVSEPIMSPVPAEAVGIDDHGEPCCTAPKTDNADRTPITVNAPWNWLDALRANAEAVVLVLLLIVAIGFGLRASGRKPRLELEPLRQRFLSPGDLPRPAAPVPQFEPEVVQAKARWAKQEPELA